MGVKERIFQTQLEKEVFDSAEIDFAKGLAQLAVDNGFDSLTQKQKNVLTPYLSVNCSGITDPGGHRNNCSVILEGQELLNAYELSDDSGSLMCESCRDEQSYYGHEWERISQE